MTLTPEEIKQYCPEFINKPTQEEDWYFLISTEEHDEPSEYWIETSAVKLLAQARKERDVLKQALEEIAKGEIKNAKLPISMYYTEYSCAYHEKALIAKQALASINKESAIGQDSH